MAQVTQQSQDMTAERGVSSVFDDTLLHSAVHTSVEPPKRLVIIIDGRVHICTCNCKLNLNFMLFVIITSWSSKITQLWLFGAVTMRWRSWSSDLFWEHEVYVSSIVHKRWLDAAGLATIL